VAPAIEAPEGSFTWPAISAVFICPNAGVMLRIKEPIRKAAVQACLSIRLGTSLYFAAGNIAVSVAPKTAPMNKNPTARPNFGGFHASLEAFSVKVEPTPV
jgi:hypothetical protein